jgi:hypothetical protein
MYLSTGDLYRCVNQSTIHIKEQEEEMMTEGGVGQTKRRRKKE